MCALYMLSETGLARTARLPAQTRDRASTDNRVLGKWHVYFMHEVDFVLKIREILSERREKPRNSTYTCGYIRNEGLPGTD